MKIIYTRVEEGLPQVIVTVIHTVHDCAARNLSNTVLHVNVWLCKDRQNIGQIYHQLVLRRTQLDQGLVPTLGRIGDPPSERHLRIAFSQMLCTPSTGIKRKIKYAEAPPIPQ